MAFALAVRNVPVADMNITPLVDVMLVLLIIFMVTMPLRTHALAIDLPQAGPKQPLPVAQPITLRIDADGQVTWNGSPVPQAALEGMMKVEAARYTRTSDQPLLKIAAEAQASYGSVDDVLAAAKNAGLVKIAFMDDRLR